MRVESWRTEATVVSEAEIRVSHFVCSKLSIRAPTHLVAPIWAHQGLPHADSGCNIACDVTGQLQCKFARSVPVWKSLFRPLTGQSSQSTWPPSRPNTHTVALRRKHGASRCKQGLSARVRPQQAPSAVLKTKLALWQEANRKGLNRKFTHHIDKLSQARTHARSRPRGLGLGPPAGVVQRLRSLGRLCACHAGRHPRVRARGHPLAARTFDFPPQRLVVQRGRAVEAVVLISEPVS
jgi:hypothetical protein